MAVSSGVIRILKPVLAGVALAYLATAFVDGPAPVHFQPENPYAAKQAEIVEPQAALVVNRNIMKLGSVLSVAPTGSIVKPEMADPEEGVRRTEVIGGSTMEADLPPDPEPQGGPEVKGEVEEAPGS